MQHLAKNIEALIFSSTEAISTDELHQCIIEISTEEVSREKLENELAVLEQRYLNSDFSFQLVKSGGGYQFMTKPAYFHVVSIFNKQKSNKKLSSAAMECLAIIAYKQPITKADIEGIRGVNCDYTVQKLLEKELVEIIGRSEAVGKPLIYGTSKKFMDHFGINSLADLPKLKDIERPDDNEIGEKQES